MSASPDKGAKPELPAAPTLRTPAAPAIPPLMADQCCASKAREIEELARQAGQRRVLVTVLVINAGMFVLEFRAGIIAGSTALMADATDMLGDALVYAVSLYALARSARWFLRSSLRVMADAAPQLQAS